MTISGRESTGTGADSGPTGRASHRGLPAPALGLRLLALAAVAGAGALLPVEPSSRVALTAGILIGALLGFAHYVVATRRVAIPGEVFVVAQLAVWSFLMQATGGQRSPLFVGFLLEIPLSAVLLGRRGLRLAAVGAAVAILALALLDRPLDGPRAAVATGFIAVTAILATILSELVERQRRQIEASQATLRARAENLAEELRMLGDYLSAGLLGLDDLGRVVSLNQPAAEILGVDREAALGRAWLEVLRLDGTGRDAVLRTLAEGTAQRGLALVHERADGRRVGIEGELWVSPSANGRRTWLMLSTDRPEHAGGDPLRRLGEAVACVSHQIKNSLHALQGFAGEIDREMGANAKDSTRDLVRALRSLGQLADDVLAMAGAPRPADERVPLDEALSTAVTLARVPGARVQVAPGPGLHVRGHRGQIVHALFNLLDNACRVTPAGRPILVLVAEDSGRASIEIRDDGPGLPADLTCLDGPAPSRNGSGFGLLAARRFIEANHGALVFEPRPEGGTATRVFLPLATLDDAEPGIGAT